MREYSDVQIGKAINRQSEWTLYAVDKDIQNLVRLPSISPGSLVSGKVIISAVTVEFERLYLVSEFDFKKRIVSSSLDALFNRSAETYILDNRDRIQELNQFLQGKAQIAETPDVIEQVPILDPGKLAFSRKTA